MSHISRSSASLLIVAARDGGDLIVRVGATRKGGGRGL